MGDSERDYGTDVHHHIYTEYFTSYRYKLKVMTSNDREIQVTEDDLSKSDH